MVSREDSGWKRMFVIRGSRPSDEAPAIRGRDTWVVDRSHRAGRRHHRIGKCGQQAGREIRVLPVDFGNLGVVFPPHSQVYSKTGTELDVVLDKAVQVVH